MPVKPTYEELEQKIRELIHSEPSCKMAAESLKENEARYQTVLDTINEGVILQSATGEVLTWNKGAEKIFGISADEIRGRVLECRKLPLIHEDGSRCDGENNPFTWTLQTGKPRSNEIMGLIRSTADLRWFSINTSPLFRNGEERPYAVAISLYDITEKREIESEAFKNRERFRDLAEMLPEAVFEADLDVNFTFVNRKALKMFGYSGQDFERGLNGMEMLASGDRKRAQKTFLKRIKGHAAGASEYLAVKKDGSLFPILLQASPIIEKGVPVGLRGIIIDITDTKKMEERLIEIQKMESIGTLAGGIAHDFNNILAPIILHSEMLLEDLTQNDPMEMSVKEIYTSSIRARDLVKQILAFAKKGTEERSVVRASLIVKETIKFLRSTIPATIDIRYDISAEKDSILADPTQLNQIIMNLCTNAAHAMRAKGGILKIILGNENITSRIVNRLFTLKPGLYLKISVTDTGTGIPPYIIDKIFEPYYTTKGPGEGTGLGLAIIHGIVKNYGGSINVESCMDEGTAFYVYLPVVEAEASRPEKPEGRAPRGRERILIIDDEKPGLNAMRKMLERSGYNVTARSSSIDAIETFRNDTGAFDIVITDMTMPNITGKELVKEFKTLRPDLPVILFTGFSDQIDEKEAKKMGIDAFIMKPIIRNEVAHTIRNVLDSRH